MSQFKSLEIIKYPRAGHEVTDDTLYWKRLAFPVACKEYGSIDYVDLSVQEPYNIAVTCSSKVQIYSSVDNKVTSTFSRFKKTAYGGVFRKDGKLLVAGSEDNHARLFEVNSGKPLRIFKGHTAPVHRCNFIGDGSSVVSFSDDKSVALWDIPTEARISNSEHHKDYVRAGAVNQACPYIFLSGSYDHTVTMHDTRILSPILSVNHGAPVESVLMFPTGGIFLSAGGTYIKVWDRVAGRLLSQITQHHKTITSLCLASDGRRLLSGSLDRHVKIYDVSSYEVVHTLDYPSPVLSIGVSPEDKVVVAGMVDGLVSIRHQKPAKDPKQQQERRWKKNAHYQNRIYGSTFKPSDGDIVVPELSRSLLAKHDKHLKKFESTKALDTVLQKYMAKRKPEIAISVIMELIRRGSLKAAMAGRSGDSLELLLKFITKYIRDPRFMRVLIDVGLMLVEIYGSKLEEPNIKKSFKMLVKSVDREIEYMKEMMEVQGMIQGVIATAHTRNFTETQMQTVSNIKIIDESTDESMM